MRDRLTDLGPDTVVVMITFTTLGLLDTYLDDYELPFPVLLDPERDTYRAYGLARGSWHRVWGLRAARRYIELIRRDGLGGLHRPTEDTLQLGGDFVIAPDGTLAWGYWGEGPDDRPSVDDLVEAVGEARVRGAET